MPTILSRDTTLRTLIVCGGPGNSSCFRVQFRFPDTPTRSRRILVQEGRLPMHLDTLGARRWLLGTGALAASALLLAGCAWFGGGRASQPSQGEVRLGDFYFEPDELEVRAGQEVTLRLRNVGATIHNFRI